MSSKDSKSGNGRAQGGDVLADLERAVDELPSGSAAERLTHYCGRVFDRLRSPDFVTVYRASLLGRAGPDPARAALLLCLGATAGLIAEGIERREFTVASTTVVARLIVSSLFARAHWCADCADPGLRGACSRAVAETLELVWPALGRTRGATGDRSRAPNP